MAMLETFNLKNKELSNLTSNYFDNPFCHQVYSSNISNKKYVILPGLCDLHAHFREPGFSYKETIKTGSLSASRGGYTTVCTMPNLNPTPDCLTNLNKQLEIIERDAIVEVLPYGSITKGQKGIELSNMEEMANYVCAFSDDGVGVQKANVMKSAMEKAKKLNKIIVAHAEDNTLLKGGYIHDGKYARLHSHKGISSSSEYKQIERDIELVKETGASYHVCHISTKESVELIRQAKKQGLDVTAETAPHYLVMCDEDLQEDGNFKMNPPLRSREDKQALIEGVKDGTIDIIATDHAPHTVEEKNKGLADSKFGIVGLETAFPLLYTNLVKTNIITFERLVELMSVNPRKRFNIKQNEKDFTIFEISNAYKIDSSKFLSMGRNTPFNGVEVYGNCVLTVKNGKIIYENN